MIPKATDASKSYSISNTLEMHLDYYLNIKVKHLIPNPAIYLALPYCLRVIQLKTKVTFPTENRLIPKETSHTCKKT